jgi:chromosome segregation ATPase
MAKPSTIGINPLDAQVQDNPLEAVVSATGTRAWGGQGLEQAAAALERLEEFQRTFAAFREELSRLRGEMTSLRGDLTLAKNEGAAAHAAAAPRQQEVESLRRELTQVKAELAGLMAEFTRIKSTPSDIPWWMGGRKKS